MKKSLVTILLLSSVIFIFSSCFRAAENKQVTISLWTNERLSESGLQWIKELAADFYKANGYIKIEVLNKGTKALLEDFQTAALAGTAPDLLLTISGHANPFITSGLIQPIDAFANSSQFIEPVESDGKTWAIPVSYGNHLMLMINKKYISSFPSNTDDFINAAKMNTKDDMSGLVYNFNDALWLIPWLGGFGGKIFASDGITPTLDTAAMVNTLTFIQDLKFRHAVVPAEADYAIADTLFNEGKAAMIINGDWSINKYKEALGENLMIGRLPKVSASGKWPSPYISGSYLMIPVDLPKEKESSVQAFIAYILSAEQQNLQLKKMLLIPGLKEGLSNPLITSDPLIAGSVAQLEVGTPTPIGFELIAVMNAINSQLDKVMDGTEIPAEAAKKMQIAAVQEINSQK